MINIENIPPVLRKKGIEKKLQKICEENNVVFLAIFGSYVRGEQKKRSDVDILIKLTENSGKTLLDIVDIEYKLKRAFGKKIDLVEMEALNKHIKNEVLNSVRSVYAKR
ncbi:MAG: nucleotidyltransferase domain-containing protein [Planctomycetota bacterium]